MPRPARAGDDRRLQRFGQCTDLFARVHCAAADEYHRVARLAHEPGRLFDGLGVHGGSSHGHGKGTVVKLRLAGKERPEAPPVRPAAGGLNASR